MSIKPTPQEFKENLRKIIALKQTGKSDRTIALMLNMNLRTVQGYTVRHLREHPELLDSSK